MDVVFCCALYCNYSGQVIMSSKTYCWQYSGGSNVNTAEEIRCVFDDNSKRIFVKSS